MRIFTLSFFLLIGFTFASGQQASIDLGEGFYHERIELEVEDSNSRFQVCGLEKGKTYMVHLNSDHFSECDFSLGTPGNPFPGGQKWFSFEANSSCHEFVVALDCPVYKRYFFSFSITQKGGKPEITGIEKGPLAVLVTNVNSDVTGLIEDVLFPGSCYTISNVVYDGQPDQVGNFSSGTTSISLEEGVILSSGNINDAPGPNSSSSTSTSFGTSATDADMSGLAGGGALFDYVAIEFDIAPSSDVIAFDFVFANEEYCEFSSSPTYNDVFACFLSGPGITGPYANSSINMALLPTGDHVSNNTVNDVVNNTYFIDNLAGPSCGNGTPYAPNDIEYDGFTTVLSAMATGLTPGDTYHMKLVLTDVGDGSQDAAVFLAAVDDSCCPFTVDTGADINICEGASASISTTITDVSGFESYTWTASPASALSYLSATNVANPTINLPAGTAVNVTYTLTVSDVGCEKSDAIEITTFVPPAPTGGSPSFCSGDFVVLDPGTWNSYQWSTNETLQTITVNTGGTYTVTVTDGNGCTGIATFNVTENALPDVTISGGPGFCEGGDVDISAPAGYNSYSWSTSETSQTINVSAAGTYTVTVIDANMCTNSGSIDVVEVPNAPITITPSDVLCDGASIDLDAGAGYSSYSWSTAETSQMITVGSSGTYGVTVEDINGCILEGTLDVTQSPPLDPVINGVLDYCEGSSTQLTVSGGPFNSYQWSDMATTASITVNSPGTYSVTVSDAAGCESDVFVDVTENPLPQPDITGSLSVCPAGATSTTLDAGGGFTGYSWSSGGTSQLETVTGPGGISVTVTDNNGCEGEQTVTIDEFATTDPVITGDNTLCPEEVTTIDAGDGFASYSWSTGDMTQQTTTFGEGTYIVTVTDANGCETIGNFNASPADVPEPEILGDANFCEGDFTTLTVNGVYDSYSWNGFGTPNADGSQYTVAAPGVVMLDVTNEEGCVGSTFIEVLQIPLPNPTINGNSTICQGETGFIDAGGGYSMYLWNNGWDEQVLGVNDSGTYSVTVTDNYGCTGEASIEVEQSESLNVTISGALEICADNGSTVLDAGAGFNSYSWSDGSEGQQITVSEGGFYAVTVTNTTGCTGEVSVEVTELAPVVAEITGDLQVCEGGSTLLGLSEMYQNYFWSDGSTGSTYEATAGEVVEVEVVDFNGCVGTTQVTITNYAAESLLISGPDEICEGGTIELTATGGFSSYLWSTGEVTQNIIVDEVGYYAVLGITSNGCEVYSPELEVTLQPTEITITGDTTFCEGSSVVLSVTAGFDTYEWSDGSMGNDQSFDQGGLLTVTATSSTGCTAQSSVTLVSYALPEVSIVGSTSFCPGGAAELSSDGVFEDYVWTDMSTSANLTVTVAGNYGLTVTDVNGCEGSDEVTVEEQTELNPVISGDLSYCEGGNTTLGVGSGYMSYSWSNGSDGPTAQIDSPGPVTVFVTDAFGCSGETSVDVLENANPTITITGETYFCSGDTATVSVEDLYATYQWSTGSTGSTASVSTAGIISLLVTDSNGCEGGDDFEVTEAPLPAPGITGDFSYCPGQSTTISGESGFVSYSWTGGATTESLAVDTVGVYELVVVDANGCMGSNSVNVIESVTQAPQITGVTDFCPGESTTLTVSNSFVSYSWSTGAETAQIQTDEGNTYSVVATDGNGCETTASVTTTIFSVTDPQITGPSAFCAGDMVTLDAGSGYAGYAWSTTAATQQIIVSSGADYEVTVTDGNGCETTGSYEVTENALPEVNIGGSTSYCIGGFTTLNAGGTYAGYMWSEGSTSQSIDVSIAGTFSLTVTDANGCEGIGSVAVTEDTELTPVISGPLSYCATQTTTLDAGSGFTTYQWNDNSSGSTLEVSSPGTYSVTVTDNGGCIGETSVAVTENALPQPQISGTLEYCATQTTTLDAGTGFASYDWSTGDTDQTLEVSSPGMYTVAVTNSFGCVDSTMVAITENPLPQPQISGTLEYCATQTTTLDAGTGFASYDWSTGDTDQTLEVSSPGMYTVAVTNSFGCVDSTMVAITENPLPQPQISGTLEYCATQTTTLDAGTGFASYDWSTGDTDQTLEVSSPGMYAVAVTNSFGCVDSTMVAITENPLPQPQISGSLAYCMGENTTLDVGGGYTQYNWSTGEVTQALLVESPGTYMVAVTNSFGCIDSTGVAVVENELPTLSISGTSYYCAGSSTQLEVTGTFIQIEWTNSSVSTTVDVTTPGIIGATATNEFGCEAYEEILIEEVALPIASAGDDLDLDCDVLSTLIGSDQTSIGMEYVYQWTGPGIDNTNENLFQPEVDLEGQYSLVVTDTVHNCISEVSMIQVVDLAYVPVVSLEVTDDLDCVTQSVTLDGSGSHTGPEVIYSWRDGAGQVIAEGSEQMIAVSQADVYSMEVMDMATGCHNMDSVSVMENIDIPLAVAGDGGHLDCNVLSYTLDGTASETGGNISYSWEAVTGFISSGSNTATPEVTQPGVYMLTVLNEENGCEGTDEVEVTQDITAPVANAGENQEIDCNSETVTINASGTSTGSNIVLTWSYGGSILTQDGLIFDVSEPGLYTLLVENQENGCSSESDVLVTLDANAPTGILAELDSPTCFGDADGSLVISGIEGGRHRICIV